MQRGKVKASLGLNLRRFIIPRNNHWLKRSVLIFAFILFDYLSTLIFCRSPCEEANLCARIFMESLGIPLGLTLFVSIVNLPIYITLSLDSWLIRLPFKIAAVTETFVDIIFAWFIAGLHFSGGSSWFWYAPNQTRQAFGALLYLIFVFLFVKPHNPKYDDLTKASA
jgi:hypothetical protein